MSRKDKLQQSKGGAKKTWTSSKGEKARHNYGVSLADIRYALSICNYPRDS
jgi:hypothetical protein